MEVMAEDSAAPGFDPGFVLDDASGLYFHASSGFYHDAKAGWYYNTKDGVYYKFEEGTYVPIAAAMSSGNVDPDSEIHEDESSNGSKPFDVPYLRVSSSQEPELSKSAVDPTHDTGLVLESAVIGDASSEGKNPEANGANPHADIGSVDVGFPLWHYDSLRSMYWYYDKETKAYYQYHEEAQNALNESTAGGGSRVNSEHFQEEHIHMKESGGQMENLNLQEATQHEDGEDNPRPASEWIEETLIDLYLRGYPSDSVEKDDGPWITSADIFSEGSPRDLSRTQQGHQDFSYNRNDHFMNDASAYADLSYDRSGKHPFVDDSDVGRQDYSYDRNNHFIDGQSAYADVSYKRSGRHPSDGSDEGRWDYSYDRNNRFIDDQSAYADVSYDRSGRHPSVDDSDEGSEDLEEGEWVPDEPLRIIDGSEFYDVETVREKMDSEALESRYSAEPQGDDGDYHGDLEDGELEEGEIEQGDEDTMNDTAGELMRDDPTMNEGQNDYVTENPEKMAEELWQAQYGQVVREKAKEHVIPGAIDLWDWAIVEMEPKTLKSGKITRKLVGRIASSVTKLVTASSGLIRTSAIRAAELDFVKVSSDKIYRLRRPSIKHLNSLGAYDSANPTKDWGFPGLGFSLLEDPSAENGIVLHETERKTDPLVSKPFVPNTGHWKFQALAPSKTKKGKRVVPPAALLASKYLSPEEIALNEERKQKYRDRAAERRTLHRGFGTGPGHKGLTANEQEKEDAESAIGMQGALKQASLALPLGKDNVGKRMLEGMGWKDGQTLGMDGGLAAPIQARGNEGRSGLGWK